jgi:hypothetical protein
MPVRLKKIRSDIGVAARTAQLGELPSIKEPPPKNHCFDRTRLLDVLERIALQENEIRDLPGLDAPKRVLATERDCRTQSPGA